MDNLLSVRAGDRLTGEHPAGEQGGNAGSLLGASRRGRQLRRCIVVLRYRLHPVGPRHQRAHRLPVRCGSRRAQIFTANLQSQLPDDLTSLPASCTRRTGRARRSRVIVRMPLRPARRRRGAAATDQKVRLAASWIQWPLEPTEATNMMLDAGFPRGALNYWKSSFHDGPERSGDRTLMIASFRACAHRR